MTDSVTVTPPDPHAAPVRGGLVTAGHAVADAWRVRTVRRGFYATLAIAVGSLSPAYLPRSSPWWSPLNTLHFNGVGARVVGTLLVLGGIGVLVDAWFQLRPLPGAEGGALVYHRLRHWAILAIWGLPFLAAPPILSQDAYSYAAQGWLVHNHIDPYRAGPGVLPGAFADQVAWVWRYTPAPYGPLSLQIAHVLDALASYHPYLSALLMRIPALLGVVCIGLLVPRIARQMGIDPAPAAWFATLNPILVIDFIGGAHNDSLMLGFIVLGLWLAGRRGRWWIVAALIIGVGASVKQPAFLAAYAVPLIARPWTSWRWRETGIAVARGLAALLLSVAAFVGVTELTGLGYGWSNAVNVPGLVITVSPSTTLGYGLQFLVNLVHLDPTGHLVVRYTRTVFLVVAGLIVALMAFTTARRRPITFVSYGYLAVAFLSPALHTWYVLWGGVLVPLTRPGERQVRFGVWTTIALLSYAAINLSWRNGLVALGIAALVAYLWMVHEHHVATRAAEAPADPD
ncbi:MAG TPA: polyprenol phosphomannose-dependent alpha 1,6 mannosyltransferase MptB [Propionibacteriaceae bacterium]|nr:polyprenol phosphomannose-dependent alpha 1,6 mannosyltransferase MptB [Propionibacteriaceae bacterium]